MPDKDKNIDLIKKHFKVPGHVQDKIKNIVEKVMGGYELIETRPRWDGSPGPWTKLPIAKIIFHKPSKSWKIYWHRASGKWNLYRKFKSLNSVLKCIKNDEHGCFFG
ncbi:MAG: hypothetical protein COU31_04715 [Candidatus Magasanikbacteria bacterium CG10_big_fil_rev_8_21_14_0_10_40_10]|uniref:DUF3024 domain-containing protein n=1 Tax=Candidatus Magasanikbacteria bacterium CG10_big_fil_rev_8_21_14_0_10_40_10 TaxID=1974648 RepID=A0A2M6W2U6_9BACT|nr:MAG: hypothetical protein COU31_04715 [Candidatus Magasanikbacteria bacterium CG10_big_fil_rev_8_21_14_0_10_40_10]